MNVCEVEYIEIDGEKIPYLRKTEDMSILIPESKYLKHKVKEHCSPNTVRRIAYALTYYLNFLDEIHFRVEEVVLLGFEEQYDLFLDYLYWLKSGKHSKRNDIPRNNTCNSYLKAVFGYYEYLIVADEIEGRIKVLENRGLSYSGIAGVRFRKRIQTFKGYLPSEDSVGKTITKENIQMLLETSDSTRNKLLILLLVETGFRIGELLGVRYTNDIDHTNHTIKVWYREKNENRARAKNAENRRAKISDETYAILMHYMAENRELLSKTDYLFISLFGANRGKPLTVDAVYSAFRVLEEKTGIAAKPHMFRHYFANERRKAGWSIEKISHALGHKHISTTERYMNIEDEEMAAAMEEFYENNPGLCNIEKLL